MKHNVTITTENRKEGNGSYCTIVIKGYKENTDAAVDEIRKILDESNRNLRLRLEEKKYASSSSEEMHLRQLLPQRPPCWRKKGYLNREGQISWDKMPIHQQDPPLQPQPQPQPQKYHKTRQQTVGNHEQSWQKILITSKNTEKLKPAENNTKETTPTDIQRKQQGERKLKKESHIQKYQQKVPNQKPWKKALQENQYNVCKY